MTLSPAAERPAWRALAAHHAAVSKRHLRELFAADPKRAERFSLDACGIHFDYSKNRVTDETLQLLVRLADESDCATGSTRCSAATRINVSENRAVLHVALRAPKGASIVVDGENVVPQVHAVLDKMSAFSRTRAQRRVERPHRQAHPQRRQHRHRRIRPRPGDGVRSAARLQPARPDVPFRLQRRRHRFRRRRRAISIRRKRCSSCRRKRSPRSRR